MQKSDLQAHEYSAYYQHYIQLAPENDVFELLDNSRRRFMAFFGGLSEDKQEYRYALGKWTAKEMVQHLIDCERIFCYRALCFARADQTNLPGFDHNAYVDPSLANKRSMSDLLEEYDLQRRSTILLFKSFDTSMAMRIGNANNSPLSVRAIGFIIGGHETHHCEVFKERYL